MPKRTHAALAAVLLAACAPLRVAPTPQDLRAELLRMEAEDQEVANRLPASPEETAAYDRAVRAVSVRHTRRMKEIVHRHGWPRASVVGEDGARAAWLLVQHADHDRAFQRRVLTLMEPLAGSGEARRSHLAYLWDRTHEPQRYGTQGDCVGRGVWAPFEIEDPEGVDARRAYAGIFPAKLADYVAMMARLRCDHDGVAAPTGG
jgi:hypothetical protein